MTFTPVKIGSGGFVTGLLAADKLYARTDNGGFFSLESGNQWRLVRSGAIEAIAKASDGSIYVAKGSYTHKDGNPVNGTVEKILPDGTVQTLALSVPVGANEYCRWVGERIKIDPLNPNIVYYATRKSGLQRSLNAGQSWNQLSKVPVGLSNNNSSVGVTFVIFSGSAITVNGQTRSPIIYVGIARVGIYRSSDGGETWNSILAQDVLPQNAVLKGNSLYVTFLGNGVAIRRYDTQLSTWSDLLSSSAGYGGIGLLPDGNIIAIRYPSTPTGVVIINSSTNVVTTINNPRVTTKPAWWPDWVFWSLSSEIVSFGDYVYLGTGIGVIRSSSASNYTQWTAVTDGLEQLVAFDATCPQGKLVSATADFNGFYHADLAQAPAKSHVPSNFSSTTSIAFCDSNSSQMAMVSANHSEPTKIYSGYSTDGGQNWQKFASIVNSVHPSELNFGNIAISATDPNNIVWLPTKAVAIYYSTNKGATWTKTTSQYTGAHTHVWNKQKALVADTVTGGTFYLYQHDGGWTGYGRFLRSQDGGANWTVVSHNALPEGYWDCAIVKAVPGQAGNIWVSLDTGGLWKSTNAGVNWSKIASVQSSQLFCFGYGTNNPTAYMIGLANGDSQIGLYYSSDLGSTWNFVETVDDSFGLTCLTADLTKFGRIFLGTDGSSFFYKNVSSPVQPK